MSNIEQFRDPDLATDGSVVGFYPREFYVFDNFSSFQVDWRGRRWPTSEHAYQAAHFFETAPELAEQIFGACSAHAAYKIAKANTDKAPVNWDEIKIGIMEEIVRAKCEQNPYVKDKLLLTLDEEIVEDSPKDSFWGWGADRQGRNELGKIWMRLRDELRQEKRGKDMVDIVFATGNQNKADYLAKLLGMPMQHRKVELDELQSTDLKVIVEHKVRQAYEKVQKPVLVEDVSFSFRAFNGLPGPFIKFFIQPADGLEKLCRMLDAFEDRSATAECMFGYFDGKRLEFLTGRLEGFVADHPRGENGFGWDKIFCPDGYDGRTRAELSNEEYDELYPTIRPVAALRELLSGN